MSITWNGVSSDTIGVIVERIPNRYVPTRRFSPQQVAGRNGNILLVDKAFPNVEQEYEVYLSAEAQGLPSVARACAEWLMGPDGYCRLTDSYDTTVYREAFLMGGYDLENILNKFGRCTITFSCKPQKYLLTGDTPIEIHGGPTTYTGDVVQFDGITGASITSLSTTITPTQDLHGYDRPWPAGGGKNIFDITQITNGSYGGLNYTVSNGIISYNGVATSNGWKICFQFNLPQTGTYHFHMDVTGDGGSFLEGFADKGTDATIVCTDTNTGYRIAFVATTSGQSYSGTIKNIQIETGSTYSGYSPYSNICPIAGRTGVSVYVSPTQDVADATTYAVDWTTEAGTVYGGTLDVTTGVLTVDRAIVDLGTLNYTYNTTSGVAPYFYSAIGDAKRPVNIGYAADNIVCSIYKTTKRTAADFVDKCITLDLNGAVVLIEIKDLSYSDPAVFKTAMNGVQLVYELATPITYQLTPQEIQALVGTNNVWSSSGDVSVTVTTPLGGIVTNPTPFEAMPLLEVSGVGEITINGKSIQILESVSDFEIDCETMEAEDNSKIYCMDFPELSGGENEIVSDGSITALTVTPRWWTL